MPTTALWVFRETYDANMKKQFTQKLSRVFSKNTTKMVQINLFLDSGFN